MTQTTQVWKNYNGIDVSVDDSGDFCAEVGGVFMRDGVWERLRLRIENEKKADAEANHVDLECVALIGTDDDSYTVKELTLIGLNRKDSSFKWEEKIDKNKVWSVLPRTPKNTELLEQLAIAKSTVRDIEQAIKDRTIPPNHWGGRIDPSKYNQQLKSLMQRYNIALLGKGH